MGSVGEGNPTALTKELQPAGPGERQVRGALANKMSHLEKACENTVKVSFDLE